MGTSFRMSPLFKFLASTCIVMTAEECEAEASIESPLYHGHTVIYRDLEDGRPMSVKNRLRRSNATWYVVRASALSRAVTSSPASSMRRYCARHISTKLVSRTLRSSFASAFMAIHLYAARRMCGRCNDIG